MKTTISPEKTEIVKAEYNNSPEKENKSIHQYVKDKAASDTNFVPWLFDFEQKEDFDNGLTIIHHDAFDAWVDKFHRF